MTLPFSTHWPSTMPKGMASQPTHFVEKIWKSMPEDIIDKHFGMYLPKLESLDYPMTNNLIEIPPKIHTMRKGHRFKAGDWIHPVIHNRTKRRFQFMPTFACTGTQTIKIAYDEPLCDWFSTKPTIVIDGSTLSNYDEIELLAFGDGFSNVKSFLSWFNQDFEGQIIHWTSLRYQ